MPTLKELGERKATIWQQMKEMNELAKAENRSFSNEEEESWARANTDLEAIEAEEVQLQKAEDRNAKLADLERQLNSSKGRKTQPDNLPAAKQEERSEEPTGNEKRRAEYRQQFSRFLKAEMPRSEFESIVERRALQVDSPPAGGYITLPQEMVSQLIKNLDNVSFIRPRASVYQVPMAQSLGVPTLENDPSDATWTGEILTGSEDSTMSFGKRALSPHPCATRIKVSRTLLRMAMIGAESLVTQRLTYKFDITEEQAFLTGSGAGQPLGVFTASADGIPTSRDVSDDNTSTAITADGLINCKFSLKAQYQNSPKVAWAFSRTAVRNIRKLKDGSGQYLWQPGLSGTPGTILDVPYFMSEYVPSTFTSGLYVGIIGDWSHYWIADAMSMGIQRLDELYAETNQVGFIARKETDGMPVLPEAFARVKLG